MARCNKAVLISGSATYGNDPIPLYQAGEKTIACVIELEALAQIQVSSAVFTNRIGSSGQSASFGGVTIADPVLKYSLTAQSGTAYYVDTLTAIGIYR